MNKSGGVVPKVLRFPSFKSLNCQPFPDFIDSYKSFLQLERMSFHYSEGNRKLLINELGYKKFLQVQHKVHCAQKLELIYKQKKKLFYGRNERHKHCV
jgi:hypothetical protein